MDRRNEDTALLALRGGLRGRFRRSFDSMENAFEVLQDRLQHAVNPAERAELMPLLEELQTQLICLRRLGDQASDAATAALLHGGLRPQVLVLDALLTKPSVTQVLQEISTMQPDPEPAVLVLVPVPEETAARKALGLFAQYRIMLRPYGMKNLFDEIYRMGTTDDEHRLYHLRRCCEDVLDDFGARSTLNGYRYAERMLLYALYAERPQKIGDLQQYVASEENIEIGTVTSALNRMSAGMSKRGAEPYRGLCLRCGRPENGVLSNGQLFEGLLKELRRRLEPTV